MGALASYFWGGSGGVTANSGYGGTVYDDPRVRDRILYGTDADAALPGDRLRRDDALTYSPWYRAVTILSNVVGQTPLEVKTVRRTEDGTEKRTDLGHRSYWPLRHQANDEETAQSYLTRMVYYASMDGSALARIVQGETSPEFVPVLPLHWRPERRRGVLYYRVNPVLPLSDVTPDGNSYDQLLRPDEVIVIKGPSPDGLLGLATAYLARHALYEGLSGSRVRSARAKNAGRPAIVLSTDQALTEAAVKRYREDFWRIHSGFDSAGKPAILDRGMTATSLPYAPEYQAEQALAMLPIRDVANFTGVPSSLIGDVERPFESMEMEDANLIKYGIGPWWNIIEDEKRAKLLSEEDRRRESRTIEFDRSHAIWADVKSQSEAIKTALGGAPHETINEVRARKGLPPRPEPEARKLLIPANIGQGGGQNQPTDPAAPSPGRPRGRAEMAAEAAARRLCAQVSRKASTVAGFMEFTGRLVEDYQPVVSGILAEAGHGNADAAAGRMLAACHAAMLELAGRVKNQRDLHAEAIKLTDRLEMELPDLAATGA